MDTFDYVIVAILLVMVGLSIGGLIVTIADSQLQRENEQLKKMLRAVLKMENISFEAYCEMAQEAARDTRGTKLMPHRKLSDLNTAQTGKVNGKTHI